ncbi:MAG: Rieske 2Fe-2S domain-containing protein [Xanthobacteraceae bacterium]|nr:Rieske 2Fe-2S domain-containing protein [Xanthobacteraceae bacterium]
MTKANSDEPVRGRPATRPFGGYDVIRSTHRDEELTLVDKGTPCGEYLRRFWQPLALASDVRDLPFAARLLGEDLVVFRTRAGRLGVLHKHCSHRGASLEFGQISDEGIRCGYHGWHYAADGRILDVPAETRPGSYAQRMCHGAYPVREYKGIVFAYLGPPGEQPEFPIYDFMDAAGEDCVPYCWPLDCNWLQVRENTQDPIHLTFLHSMFGIKQFGANLANAIPFIRAHETPLGQVTTSIRRLGDIYYVRINEMIMPNVARVPDALREGRAIPNNEANAVGTGSDTKALRYKRLLPSSHGMGLSMWVIPNDNENSMFFGWHHVPSDEPQSVRDERIRQVEHGQTKDRPYHERQRNPGDYDAIVSQGKIVARGNDKLTSADVGIGLYRHQLRSGIRAVAQNQRPKGLDVARTAPIPTFAYALVRPAPPTGSAEEEAARVQALEKEIVADLMAFRLPQTSRALEPA